MLFLASRANKIVSHTLHFIEYSEQILSHTKKVATMVVDEILLEISHGQKFDWIRERIGGEEYIVYWTKVRFEIQNITLSLP